MLVSHNMTKTQNIYQLRVGCGFWIQKYPGHSFGKKPGVSIRRLMQDIYFQLDKKKNFVDFRMRKNQPNAFSFK